MQFQFQTLSDFFAMGGYALYVWLAYGVTFFTTVLLILQSKRETRRILTQVKMQQMRENVLKGD